MRAMSAIKGKNYCSKAFKIFYIHHWSCPSLLRSRTENAKPLIIDPDQLIQLVIISSIRSHSCSCNSQTKSLMKGASHGVHSLVAQEVSGKDYWPKIACNYEPKL